MRRVFGRIVVGLVASLVLSSLANAQAFDLPSYLETIRQKYELPSLAAAVARDGDVIAAAAVGTRVRGMSIPVTVDDRYHIGSDTKAMTATLAGMMVDEGKLTWESTVGEILGDDVKGMNPKLAAVTLEQLLSHSSGIPSDNNEMMGLYLNIDGFEYNPREWRLRALEGWKHNEPVVPEGSPFQYSNFGYMIAGMMVEKAAGIPWEQLIYERLFDPLGLPSAGIGPQATTGLIDAPVGHRIEDNGEVTPIFWGPAADVPALLGPAGAAHLSIRDFAKWAAWNAGEGKRGPALVKLETLHRIHKEHVQTPRIANPRPGTPQEGGYALGWGVIDFDWTGRPVLTHNGSNSMNLAKILVDTEADLGIVVTTNFPGPDAEAAASDALEALYKEYVPH